LSVLAALVYVALSGLLRYGQRTSPENCRNNLKQIGLAFKTWSPDQADTFPFNRSTNEGGTREFCARGGDGFDAHAALHFRVLSNEIGSPLLLVCPRDKSRKAAADFSQLQSSNVTYWLHTGPNVSEENPDVVLAVCPIDGNTLYCDGSVKRTGKPPWFETHQRDFEAGESYTLVALVVGPLLLVAGNVLDARLRRANATPKTPA
jgi:hypothetical protein